jgi:hypothetical protein
MEPRYERSSAFGTVIAMVAGPIDDVLNRMTHDEP